MEVGREWELRDGDFRRREQTGSLPPPRNPHQFVIGEPRVLVAPQPVVFYGTIIQRLAGISIHSRWNVSGSRCFGCDVFCTEYVFAAASNDGSQQGFGGWGQRGRPEFYSCSPMEPMAYDFD
jgi:hypothetical protein